MYCFWGFFCLFLSSSSIYKVQMLLFLFICMSLRLMTYLICRNTMKITLDWLVFQGVISYQDLVKCFTLIIQSLQHGDIQPWVGLVVYVEHFLSSIEWQLRTQFLEQTAWVWVTALLLTSCVNFDRFLHFRMPQIPHL